MKKISLKVLCCLLLINYAAFMTACKEKPDDRDLQILKKIENKATKGFDIEAQNSHGETIFEWTFKHGLYFSSTYLLRLGAKATLYQQSWVLNQAIERGDASNALWLFRKGAQPSKENEPTLFGWTLDEREPDLGWKLTYQGLSVPRDQRIRLLQMTHPDQEILCDRDASCLHGVTPLHAAQKLNDIDDYLKFGGKINVLDHAGLTPLDYMMLTGKYSLAKILIKANALQTID